MHDNIHNHVIMNIIVNPTSGRSYEGEANTTVDGIPCQRWSDTEPHEHSFTHVGDHNFCRNPNGASQSQVWCYTTDPGHEQQNCSVPFCPPLKALDFSLDNDGEADENNSYTHASLKKENLPSSFTICTAFMVEAWTKYTSSYLFVFQNDNGEIWLMVRSFAQTTYTQFSFQLEDSPRFSKQSASLFYPLQCTMVLAIEIKERKICKSKWLDFTHFSTNYYFFFGLYCCETANI